MPRNKRGAGGLLFNILNIGFTVVMFALPSLLLGYWYFYIRDPSGNVPQTIQVRAPASPSIPTAERNALANSEGQQNSGMFDIGDSIGIFSESPSTRGERQSYPDEMESESPSIRNVPQRAEYELRIWSDASNRFTVTARFYSVNSNTVKLIADDERKIDVPIDKLSEADQQYLREIFKSKGMTPKF